MNPILKVFLKLVICKYYVHTYYVQIAMNKILMMPPL